MSGLDPTIQALAHITLDAAGNITALRSYRGVKSVQSFSDGSTLNVLHINLNAGYSDKRNACLVQLDDATAPQIPTVQPVGGSGNPGVRVSFPYLGACSFTVAIFLQASGAPVTVAVQPLGAEGGGPYLPTNPLNPPLASLPVVWTNAAKSSVSVNSLVTPSVTSPTALRANNFSRDTSGTAPGLLNNGGGLFGGDALGIEAACTNAIAAGGQGHRIKDAPVPGTKIAARSIGAVILGGSLACGATITGSDGSTAINAQLANITESPFSIIIGGPSAAVGLSNSIVGSGIAADFSLYAYLNAVFNGTGCSVLGYTSYLNTVIGSDTSVIGTSAFSGGSGPSYANVVVGGAAHLIPFGYECGVYSGSGHTVGSTVADFSDKCVAIGGSGAVIGTVTACSSCVVVGGTVGVIQGSLYCTIAAGNNGTITRATSCSIGAGNTCTIGNAGFGSNLYNSIVCGQSNLMGTVTAGVSNSCIAGGFACAIQNASAKCFQSASTSCAITTSAANAAQIACSSCTTTGSSQTLIAASSTSTMNTGISDAAILAGNNHVNGANQSLVLGGIGGKSRLATQIVNAGGQTEAGSAQGNRQRSHLQLRGNTPGAGAGETVELKFGVYNGAPTSTVDLVNSTTYTCFVQVNGKTSAAGSNKKFSAYYMVTYTRDNAGTVTLDVAVPIAVSASNPATWAVAFTAGAARIIATFSTGAETEAVRVNAEMKWHETLFA